MKYCSYCGNRIEGAALPIGDDAANGAHAPAFWHADRSECGPRQRRTSLRDDAEDSRLQLHLRAAARRR